MAQNSSAPRSQEDYITQVSEEIEGRVTKRLSKEFSITENRILGALAQLDDFHMNPLLPGCSGIIPAPSRNALNRSQGTNGDDSQNDRHPEAGLFHGQMTQNSGAEDGLDMVTGATEKNRNRHDMVTGVQAETRKGHGMVTGATERHDIVTAAQKESLCGHDVVTAVQREKESAATTC